MASTAAAADEVLYDDLPVTPSFTVISTWDHTNLTYGFVNGTADIAGDAERQAVRDALALWSGASGLTFAEVDAVDAEIRISWAIGDHGDGFPFDGINGVLAHAFYPSVGDIHFDDAESWTTSTSSSSAQPMDLVTVAAHEFGHAIGLGHSSDAGALMYPYYTGSHRYLAPDDLTGVRAAYGWPSESLGGAITGAPDISSSASGGLNVFARGTNDALHHKWYSTGSGWSGWENLGGPALASGPGAVSWGPNRVDVVGRATNGSVAHWYYNGTWNVGTNLGGAILGDPDISSSASGGLNVFARGTNDALHHKWYSTGSGWSGWENLGGPALASGPGAVSWGPNRVDVVGRAANGNLLHWWFDGVSWHNENLGGTIVDDPDISSSASGTLNVFARGTNDALHHKWYSTGSGWSGWENLGGPALTTGPGAVSWGANRVDVVGRASDQSVRHWWWYQ